MNRKFWWVPALLVVVAGAGLLLTIPSTRTTDPIATLQGLPVVPPLAQPPEARIVYLGGDESVPGSALITSAKLSAALGAIPALNWQAVVSLNQVVPIDALIIHARAAGMVDREWVAQAYRRGIVIAGIDLDGAQMAELVSDNCLKRDGFASYTSGSYFVIATSMIEGASEDTARVLDSYTQRCGDQGAEGVAAATSYSARYTTEYLTDENSFNIFTLLIADHLMD